MKPFKTYQYLEGTEMTNRDKKEVGSKFWNKGKWDNFVLPFLHSNPKGMTLVEMGCNAGLFLKLAEEHGFEKVLGVDSDEEAVKRGSAWRDKNKGKYQIFCWKMQQCIDTMPMADYTLLVNTHYYFTINDWLDYLDKLQYKTRYCIIVTGHKKKKQLCWASSDTEDIWDYFSNWSDIGFIDELPFGDDPMPRRLWSFCFKSPFIERVPIDSITTRNTMQDGFYAELDKGVKYQDTNYYKVLKDYRRKWTEGHLNRWMKERVRVFESIKRHGLIRPIYINSKQQILDGNHKYGMLKYLGNKSIFIRKTT